MSAPDDDSIERALRDARDTRHLAVSAGVRHDVGPHFKAQFGDQQPIVIADGNTFAVAGRDACVSLLRAGLPLSEPFVFGPHIYADDRCVLELRLALQHSAAIPIAVGSGTINDLTKLAAHQVNRPYMALATAASMDGYTAYGASITAKGSKQTFDCPAPQSVLADLEVIARAPAGMNASGYADLLAKNVAGADWIIADSLGIEAINESVWQTVQGRLREWLSAPAAVAEGDPAALKNLVEGLMMSGFAMQAHRTSRPASGADHQFSHLWDMQHHTHQGAAPSHGFKVGIGTLASVALYEELLSRELNTLDVEAAVERWPSLAQQITHICSLFGQGELAEKAIEETRAKFVTPNQLRDQLTKLRETWPRLRDRLRSHLYPFDQLQSMLREAGCSTTPEQIGISRERMRTSYEQALFIRRRFTVLDLAYRTGLLDDCLASLFGPTGVWAA